MKKKKKKNPSKVSEDLTDEEDGEEDELDSRIPSTTTDFGTTSICDLTKFASQTGDNEALQYLTQLRLHFEKAGVSSSGLRQTTITSFFK